MQEFFHMGGYGFFVWTSYALVSSLFIYAFIAPIARHSRLKSELGDELAIDSVDKQEQQ